MSKPAETLSKSLIIVYLSVIAISLIGSLASHFLKISAPQVETAASALILLLGTGHLLLHVQAARVVGVIGLGFGVEVLGIYTGVPFGSYQYTGQWNPNLQLDSTHAFPALLPLAWVMVVGNLWVLAGRQAQPWVRWGAVALAATLFDFGLEDVMVNGLRYWAWESPGPIFGAPWVNSLGWFGTSFLSASILGNQATTGAERNSALILTGYSALMGEISLLRGLAGAPIWAVFTIVFAVLAYQRSREQA